MQSPESFYLNNDDADAIINPTPLSPSLPAPTFTGYAHETAAVPSVNIAIPTHTPPPDLPQAAVTPVIPAQFTTCDQSLCYAPFHPVLSLPVPSDQNQGVDPTYRYGTTQNGERTPHDGVEFYNPYGSPVLAAAQGVVYFSGEDHTQTWGRFPNFYGSLIILKHELDQFSQPVYTLYAHLSKRLVNTGQSVQAGQQIGEVGASGGAEGSHLHFEVRLDQPDLKNTQNPELFLSLAPSPTLKTGILVGRVLKQASPQTSKIVVIQSIEKDTVQTERAVYVETYAAQIPAQAVLSENFVLSNLPVGQYRLSTFIDEQFFETNFFIKENQITDITIQAEEKE